MCIRDSPFPVHEINRGGQATYHGPGQLVGYPITALNRCGRDLHRYVTTLENTLIETCAPVSYTHLDLYKRQPLRTCWNAADAPCSPC